MHQLNAHKPCLLRINGELTDMVGDTNSHLHENAIISVVCRLTVFTLD